MRKTLTDLLKIALGMKISQARLNKIRRLRDVTVECPDHSVKLRSKVMGDQIIEEESNYEGVLLIGRRTSWYDFNGFLLRRDTYKSDSKGRSKQESVIYDPAGSFLGKQNERYQNVVRLTLTRNDFLEILETNPESKNNKEYRESLLFSNFHPRDPKKWRKPIYEGHFDFKT